MRLLLSYWILLSAIIAVLRNVRCCQPGRGNLCSIRGLQILLHAVINRLLRSKRPSLLRCVPKNASGFVRCERELPLVHIAWWSLQTKVRKQSCRSLQDSELLAHCDRF